MNKNALDLLNTLDNYKSGIELKNHKDPYIKNKFENVSKFKGYNIFLFSFLGFLALSSSNLFLLSNYSDLFNTVVFTIKQFVFLMIFSLLCLKIYEENQKRLLLQETKKIGNPYVEEIKEHYFYNEDISPLVLDSLKKIIKIDERLLIAIENKSLETSALFKLQSEVEKKFKKTLLMKLLNKDTELEKLKKNRKKELWQMHQMEMGAKELRQHFLKNSR